MKYLFFSVLALFIGQNAYAQGISAGFRTGVGNTFDITSAREGIKHNYWEKQVFLRYETNKRFAFEISSTQYKYSYDAQYPEFMGGWGGPINSETIGLTVTNNNFDFGMSAQYDLSCHILQDKCPMLKNFKSYLGITALIILNEETNTYTRRSLSDGNITEDRTRQALVSDLQVGINHTTKYSFNRLFITSSTNITVSPRYLGSFAPMAYSENSLLNFRIGIGYTL
ncbi:MAG TPA: hypothetical protein VIN07_14565 [Flavipsychrobacter sp.]